MLRTNDGIVTRHGKAGGAVALAGMLCTLLTGVAAADPIEDFYRGKTLTMVISVGSGEGFDVNARLVAKHLARHIPGNPAIVAKNMPGAGHVLAANYIATEAPRDGSMFCAISPSIVTHQLLDGRGVRYDVGKFLWLGASDHGNQAVYSWAASGVKTLQDTMTRETIAGATGAGAYNMLYPVLMNKLIGTKFKIVAGYKHTKDLEIALQRGEVEVRAGHSLSTVKAIYGDWLRDKKINILAQAGPARDPDFPDVPLLTEFAKTESARRIFELFEVDMSIGRPFLAPPDTDPERVTALRRAFDETMRDPAFLAEAKQSRVDVHPVSADAVARIIAQAAATPTDLLAAAREAKGVSKSR
jgi:tripartite-type tricarboxylate transporter receptor subunit TctC